MEGWFNNALPFFGLITSPAVLNAFGIVTFIFWASNKNVKMRELYKPNSKYTIKPLIH